MPPKKKARLSSRAASTPSGELLEVPPRASEPRTQVKDEQTGTELFKDAWTDDQETSLFKGMIRWKPVGMHKHFRMIAISQHLRNHGYTSSRDTHTRIPGIWQKLRSLYNLEALDERENSFGEEAADDSEHPKEPFFQFRLPQDEFEDHMFAKRVAPQSSSSPPALAYQLSNESNDGPRRPSTIEDTEEPRSSPASSRGTKAPRGARSAAGTRRSRLKEEAQPPAGRRGSKASTTEDQDEGAENGEEDEVEAVEEDAASSAASPATKSDRPGTKPARGKKKRGRGGARRGGRRR
ncbi:MAG: hypothetical protein FRX48_07608 [Lasallia pustulata]|uniref:Chromatin modification-related protein Eaf7/MRGBP n=1 Tax=Lasallia pustulata TaxID=136370 RepID=A0A1W5D7K4_9LECA|nr:MAG: hypothetical protein FRX48_07608 [Lasallia pustulata]SLM39086.1 Chromatin modification-related protein Eaf7/MRGBP [Lasallia pustulata]